MIKYIIKRILTFIPMLIAISLIAFIISLNAPGDPVERMAKSDQEGGADINTGSNAEEKEKIRKKLGLHLPVFYFNVSNYATTDTLHKISNKLEREKLEYLIYKYGNWSKIDKYYNSIISAKKYHDQSLPKNLLSNLRDQKKIELNQEEYSEKEINRKIDELIREDLLSNIKKEKRRELEKENEEIKKTSEKTLITNYEIDSIVNLITITGLSIENKINEDWNNIKVYLTGLLEESNESIIEEYKNQLNNTINNGYFNHLSPYMNEIDKSEKILSENTTKWKNYIPWINFYSDNQYHQWLFGNGKDRYGLFRWDFGISYNDKKPIGDKIWDRIGISFALSLFSIIISYIVSIPIGIYSAYRKNSFTDRSMSLILFILYSLPSFFVGTLLLLWFANVDYLYWFPESGIENAVTVNPDWEWWHWEAIKHRAPYLILPLITYTYSSFAFISRIMRIGMIDVISQDYIRTARAKGLSEKRVILKHALRNSLLPIITVFAAIFPMAVGGSIIIEMIFSIPGMGLEIYDAVMNKDYPMIISFFTLAGLLTMVGYLVSDLLYAVVDPRISYK
tara:strand:+ start:2116 stop:3810 length:1695 start_codon:yes stop_codon:yes gene_type:complete